MAIGERDEHRRAQIVVRPGRPAPFITTPARAKSKLFQQKRNFEHRNRAEPHFQHINPPQPPKKQEKEGKRPEKMETGAFVFIIFLVGAGVGILRCLHKKEKRKNQGKIDKNDDFILPHLATLYL